MQLRSDRDEEEKSHWAKVLFWVIIIVLYALGGIALYLRANYLQPKATTTPAIIVTMPVETEVPQETVAPTITPSTTPTLYPTRTTNPGE